MGLFINYDANRTMQNQEKKAIDTSLEFAPEHEKKHKELSTSVAAALPEMKGKDLVLNIVRLCTVEIKFLHSCSMPWECLKAEKRKAFCSDGSVPTSPTPPVSPRIEASAAALSSTQSQRQQHR